MQILVDRPIPLSRKVMAALAVLAVVVTVSTSAGAQSPRTIEVELHNFRFDPNTIHVEAGEEVTFVVRNQSDTFHTFSIAHSAQDIGQLLAHLELSAGAEDSITVTMPDEPGELYLFCQPHHVGLDMVATIVVEPATAAEAPAESESDAAEEEAEEETTAAELPRTGGSTAGYVGGGTALMAVGFVLYAANRRREAGAIRPRG